MKTNFNNALDFVLAHECVFEHGHYQVGAYFYPPSNAIYVHLVTLIGEETAFRLHLIAQTRVRQHRLEEAYRAQKRAVARQPGALRQYVFLSDILEKMGQTAEAKSVTAEVEHLEAIGRDSPMLAN